MDKRNQELKSKLKSQNKWSQGKHLRKLKSLRKADPVSRKVTNLFSAYSNSYNVYRLKNIQSKWKNTLTIYLKTESR